MIKFIGDPELEARAERFVQVLRANAQATMGCGEQEAQRHVEKWICRRMDLFALTVQNKKLLEETISILECDTLEHVQQEESSKRLEN